MRFRGPRGCACACSCHVTAQECLAIAVLPHAAISAECGWSGSGGECAHGGRIAERSDLGTLEVSVGIGLPDYPIRVEDSTRFFAAVAPPVKEKEDDDGNKGNAASSSSASNRNCMVAASRSRRGIRHDDNRRLDSGGRYVVIDSS